MRPRRLVLALLVLAGPLAAPLAAQVTAGEVHRELRPFVGRYLPVGALRSDFEPATTLGVQAALELSRHAHIVGMVAWTRGRTKLPVSNDATHIWHYDLGGEVNVVHALGGGWRLRPFVGAGFGGRTYDFRAAELATRVCTAGYGAAGTELQTGAFALRLEGRDYLACYQQPLTGRTHTRNDLGLLLGVAYHLP